MYLYKKFMFIYYFIVFKFLYVKDKERNRAFSYIYNLHFSYPPIYD